MPRDQLRQLLLDKYGSLGGFARAAGVRMKTVVGYLGGGKMLHKTAKRIERRTKIPADTFDTRKPTQTHRRANPRAYKHKSPDSTCTKHRAKLPGMDVPMYIRAGINAPLNNYCVHCLIEMHPEPFTFEEIAIYFGLSKQRISQIYDSIMAKLQRAAERGDFEEE